MGSNLGSRFDNIRDALRLMSQKAMKNMRVSIIFETKAILPLGAPKTWDLPYFNLVVAGTTSLSPHALLTCLKEIELTMGRDLTAPRWAPRIIDLDILAWEGQIVADNNLQIPHPELMNRPFLLQLMAMLNPHFPIDGRSLAEILHNTPTTDAYKYFLPFPQMVGIVNITPDSFSDGGKYLKAEKAMDQIQALIDTGAAVIDLGAQSTRPGAMPISAEEEWQRLEPVLDRLRHTFQNRFANPKLSIDSFYPEVIEKALQKIPLDWINDVQGAKNERLLEIIAPTQCKIILTHSLTVPACKTTLLPFDANPTIHLCKWADQKINQLLKLGIAKERIILDPGIGFGKSAYQSIQLLQSLDMLQSFGLEILVGHSRKSFLKIMPNTADRDLETVGISQYLCKKKVSYLRVHHVEAHQRTLAAHALIEGLQADDL